MNTLAIILCIVAPCVIFSFTCVYLGYNSINIIYKKIKEKRNINKEDAYVLLMFVWSLLTSIALWQSYILLNKL